jgi:hypothetical protein
MIDNMDIENLFKMVEFSYEIDKFNLETKLENIINNSELDAKQKTKKIKKYIAKLALLELNKNKFNTMTNDNNNDK